MSTEAVGSTEVVVATPAPVLVSAPAPVPLTAVPAIDAAPGERTKRKYTKRAAKWAEKAEKPKRKYTKRADKAKAPKAAKVKKVKAAKPPKEKKEKRIAGTKAQGQVPKPVMRFLKNLAKEQESTVGVLVGLAVTRYAKTQGYNPEA